jgi:hypothetical protein
MCSMRPAGSSANAAYRKLAVRPDYGCESAKVLLIRKNERKT